MEESNVVNDTSQISSLPTTISRFPSLKRKKASKDRSETSSRRAYPPTSYSPPSETVSNDVFAYTPTSEWPDFQDGFNYDFGYFQPSRPQRNRSKRSLVPSFRTKDTFPRSPAPERQPGLIFSQRILAEGLLGSKESLDEVPTYPSQSPDALGKQPMQRTYSFEQERPVGTVAIGNPQDSKARESWCSCDDEIVIDRKEKGNIDIEAQHVVNDTPPPPFSSEKKPKGEGDKFTVKYDGPDDPMNPQNWPSKQKWAATACIAAFTFMSPLASSMVAPALPQIAHEFHITNPVETPIVLSIFVLAFAIGPMVLGPMSELYGRVLVSQVSNVFFLVFNTACGFATNKQQLMAFRFLSGLGGSAPLAIGGGVLGDIFKPEERGKAMGLYAMGPLLGPAIGPIVGAWVAEKSTWRWMFWATSIVNVIILIAGFIWFKESYTPYLLHKKAKKIRKDTGDARYRADGEGEVDQPIWLKITKTMGRAFGMLFTQPIVQVMSLYMGFSYGILYLMLSTFPQLFMQQYGESVGISGLNYISLGLGFFIGAPVCGKSSDIIYQKLKQRDPQKRGRPEFRMPLIIPFSFLVPVGLLTYGWSAQAKTHWIVPNIGTFLFGMGTIAAFQCVTTYLVDTYMRFAASAVAAVTILRSLMGFAFPLFAPYMYEKLDYGWGNTVLAIAAVGIGLPTPILLWTFGERLRSKSSIARNAGPPKGAGKPGGPGGPGPKPSKESSKPLSTDTKVGLPPGFAPTAKRS